MPVDGTWTALVVALAICGGAIAVRRISVFVLILGLAALAASSGVHGRRPTALVAPTSSNLCLPDTEAAVFCYRTGEVPRCEGRVCYRETAGAAVLAAVEALKDESGPTEVLWGLRPRVVFEVKADTANLLQESLRIAAANGEAQVDILQADDGEASLVRVAKLILPTSSFNTSVSELDLSKLKLRLQLMQSSSHRFEVSCRLSTDISNPRQDRDTWKVSVEVSKGEGSDLVRTIGPSSFGSGGSRKPIGVGWHVLSCTVDDKAGHRIDLAEYINVRNSEALLVSDTDLGAAFRSTDAGSDWSFTPATCGQAATQLGDRRERPFRLVWVAPSCLDNPELRGELLDAASRGSVVVLSNLTRREEPKEFGGEKWGPPFNREPELIVLVDPSPIMGVTEITPDGLAGTPGRYKSLMSAMTQGLAASVEKPFQGRYPTSVVQRPPTASGFDARNPCHVFCPEQPRPVPAAKPGSSPEPNSELMPHSVIVHLRAATSFHSRFVAEASGSYSITGGLTLPSSAVGPMLKAACVCGKLPTREQVVEVSSRSVVTVLGQSPTTAWMLSNPSASASTSTPFMPAESSQQEWWHLTFPDSRSVSQSTWRAEVQLGGSDENDMLILNRDVIQPMTEYDSLEACSLGGVRYVSLRAMDKCPLAPHRFSLAGSSADAGLSASHTELRATQTRNVLLPVPPDSSALMLVSRPAMKDGLAISLGFNPLACASDAPECLRDDQWASTQSRSRVGWGSDLGRGFVEVLLRETRDIESRNTRRRLLSVKADQREIRIVVDLSDLQDRFKDVRGCLMQEGVEPPLRGSGRNAALLASCREDEQVVFEAVSVVTPSQVEFLSKNLAQVLKRKGPYRDPSSATIQLDLVLEGASGLPLGVVDGVPDLRVSDSIRQPLLLLAEASGGHVIDVRNMGLGRPAEVEPRYFFAVVAALALSGFAFARFIIRVMRIIGSGRTKRPRRIAEANPGDTFSPGAVATGPSNARHVVGESAGIRPWMPGDSSRAVRWRTFIGEQLQGRSGVPTVSLRIEERAVTPSIFLDPSLVKVPSTRRRRQFIAIAFLRAAAALSRSLGSEVRVYALSASSVELGRFNGSIPDGEALDVLDQLESVKPLRTPIVGAVDGHRRVIIVSDFLWTSWDMTFRADQSLADEGGGVGVVRIEDSRDGVGGLVLSPRGVLFSSDRFSWDEAESRRQLRASRNDFQSFAADLSFGGLVIPAEATPESISELLVQSRVASAFQ
ncbi:MAG: hypothetical protein Q8N26_35100 [Myxococcales bacterium]|nr:hypothetical protein [Myxococcales bacterium]